MSGKFEVYEDAAGKFRFRLKASNGEVVASGRGYTSKASAKEGCESILKAAEGASVVEVSAAASGSAGRAGRNGLSGDSAVDPAEVPRPSAPQDSGDASNGAGVDPPARRPRRQFRFSGGMSAEHDLGVRSGEIVRDELGRDR